ALTQWATSISFAIAGGLGVLIGWALEHREFFVQSACIGLILCFVGALYCGFWRQRLDAYRELNTAKYLVMIEMAKRLSGFDMRGLNGFFGTFESEYQSMAKARRLVPGKFTPSFPYEFLLPRIFGLMFGIVTPIALVISTI